MKVKSKLYEISKWYLILNFKLVLLSLQMINNYDKINFMLVNFSKERASNFDMKTFVTKLSFNCLHNIIYIVCINIPFMKLTFTVISLDFPLSRISIVSVVIVLKFFCCRYRLKFFAFSQLHSLISLL